MNGIINSKMNKNAMQNKNKHKNKKPVRRTKQH